MDASEDEFVPEEEVSGGPAALKSLRERLKKAVEEKQEYLEGWQRARADLVNYKKETAAGVGESQERIKADLVEELLPALDALELALKHHEDPTLTMLEKQFLDSLKRFGVERFGKVGEEFDPRRHEALSAGGEQVASVERSGYKIGEKIIRPAHITLN